MNPLKILVVDDSEQNIELLEAMLAPQGYAITTARDGEQALKLVTETLPDLVLLDVMMPKLDGFEVTRQVRENPITTGIPILMLTALRELSDKVRGLELGADDFLSKPFNRVELVARVRSLLRIKQLRDELQAKNKLLHSAFTRYVAAEVAESILGNPEQNLKLGGQVSRLSILFADIRGFTTFSERHAAAEVLGVLNGVWERLVPLIFRDHGTFDKYLGDAVMAIYGAPLPLGDEELRAVRTAWAMKQEFEALKTEMPALREMGLGIGIFTGDAIVGNVGTEQMMDYTAIGNTPNMARRLQENATGGQILICEQTYRAVKKSVQVRPVAAISAKGRSEPLNAFEVIALNGKG